MNRGDRKSKMDKEKEKLVQDRIQMLLTRMLRDEDNKYCVDCDSKGPRWASWNLGLFVCIRCAGIHRNLGVHISKVKSVNLDSWTPLQVSSMQQMGNSRARAVYEANLPDGYIRPQNDQALEQFIRAKYEKKQYMAKEYVPEKPAEFPKGWQELIEAEKQKKDLRKIILPSHTSNNDSSNHNNNIPTETSKPVETKSPRPQKSVGADSSAKKSESKIEKIPSSAVPKQQEPKSNVCDLLGLDIGDSGSNSNDLVGISTCSNHDFGDFSSTIASSSSTTATTNVSTNDDLSLNNNGLDGLSSSGVDKSKMSKDSIMALFGKTPMVHQAVAPPAHAVPNQHQMNIFGGVGPAQPQQQPQTHQPNMFMSTFGTSQQHQHSNNLGANPQANPFLGQNASTSQLSGLNFGGMMGAGGGMGGSAPNLQLQQNGFAQTNQSALSNQFGGLNLGTNSFGNMVPVSSISSNSNWASPTPTTSQQQGNGQTNLLGMW